MKFATTLLLSLVAAVSAKKEIRAGDSLKLSSVLGQKLMAQARRVDVDGRELDEDVDAAAWIADYSLKFQGCHHLVQWNDQAEGNEDVRLVKKRLVRFRLCPSDTCSATNTGGCDSGYGEYVIDMMIYLQAYYESMNQIGEDECQQYAENYCACEGNGDDSWNENQCAYDCIVTAGMTQCYQYMEDNINQEVFEIQEFMECAQFKWEGNNRRKLDQEAQYYVGPFCSEQGGAIHLGMFSDDTCTTGIEDGTYGATTFETMTGLALPYSTKSIVGSDRVSCVVVNNDDNGNGQNDDAEVEISEVCGTAYMNAGKCEVDVAGATYPNTQACTYIEGIKIVREDGMVVYQKAHSNAVTTSFIVIFAMAFFAMVFYVWYLRTRLNVKPDALL